MTRSTIWSYTGSLGATGGEWIDVGPELPLDKYQQVGLAAISEESMSVRMVQRWNGLSMEASAEVVTVAGSLPGDGVLSPAILPYLQVQHKNASGISSATLVVRGDWVE